MPADFPEMSPFASLAGHRSHTTHVAMVLLGSLVIAGCDGPRGDAPGFPPTLNAQAPAVYRARFETSRGPFVIEVHRAWAPRGADRFHQLVSSGFLDNARFFRAVSGFMVQFGLHGDPDVNDAWEPLTIADDSVAQPNARGYLTFAAAAVPNSRNTQVFINLVDNRQLDGMGFAPFGRVVEGMDVVDSLYTGYGDGPPSGFGPDQMRLMREGNRYLEREFPRLDHIRRARIVTDSAVSRVP
ncbi:MAG: peptidylprolyl isomerase [Gemmatimonadota bacterium]